MSGDLPAAVCFLNLQVQLLVMAFSFFGKKENNSPSGVFSDRTYISTAAKMNACLELVKKDPDTLFICWFPYTAGKFKEFFVQHGIDETCITEARYVHTAMLQHKTPVFAEHYPLHSKEMELIKGWPHKEIIVFSALDEPLFRHFGSDKVIPLMKMMGMKEAEAIEHPMVSKSILRSQEKIAGKVSFELAANSPADWLDKNLK